jgi:hypothetical protein
MPDGTFFAGIAQEDLPIRDFVARSPLFYREAHVMGGFFTADLAWAQALLPTSRHRALRLLPGRTVIGVHCLEYRHSDIGPYNEVAVAVAVRCGRWPGLDAAALARAALTERYHAYVATLPVTTAAALHGGVDVFGYPKFLADISFSATATHRTCRVRDRETGELILEVCGARLRTRCFRQDVPRDRLKVMTLSTYPVKDGQTLEARLLVNQIERGISVGRADLCVRVGPGAGAPLRGLALGRPLQYLYAPRCEAILFAPRRVEGA